MSSRHTAHLRTHGFARALGPFVCIVATAVAAHAPEMKALLMDVEANPLWAWTLGAGLLLAGSVIIAFHQYWRGAAAIIISLLGWLLAAPGVLLLVMPPVDGAADLAANVATGPVASAIVRSLFLSLSLAGLYLTAVGWLAEPRPPRGATTGAAPHQPPAQEDRTTARNDRANDVHRPTPS